MEPTDELIDVELPTSDEAPEPTPDAKEKARQGYEQRQAQKRLEELTRELEGYKRREDEARKATLTETQRLKEELDALKAERERDSAQRLREKVAKEYKLPDAFVNRLVGSDEESLRVDAEELAKLLPRAKVGSVSDPVRETPTAPGRIYTRKELASNPKLAASPEVIQAMREGRVH